VLFHEYLHGDTGRGVGASHQTGWTGLIAKLIHLTKRDPEETIQRVSATPSKTRGRRREMVQV
jgi:hypothetical protein